MPESKRVYGSVWVSSTLARYFLDQDGVVMRKDPDGSIRLTVNVCASTKDEAVKAVAAAEALAIELKGLANSLAHHIENVAFPKEAS